MALPMFLAFTSDCNDKKYLRYIKELDVAEVHGFLKLSGEDVASPLTKYEIKMATCGNGLVHIRCCYNNKYWQRSSEKDSWIVAGADEPDEEHSNWSCTLFEPILACDDPLSFRFRHVQLRHYVSLCPKEVAPYDSCIKAISGDEGVYDVFKIIDWEILVVLPKNIAFKGSNKLYIKAYYQDNYAYLQSSVNEIGSPFVGDQIFPNSNGSIRIKNNYFGKFWRRNHHNWINADAAESSTDDSDTVFWPTKVRDNVIALRNEGNNMFCKVFTDSGKTGCLSAVDPKISNFAQLEVEELILERSIYNVDYQLIDYRIYNETEITVASGYAVNTTSSTNLTTVTLEYTDVFKWNWSSSVSFKYEYKSKVTADLPKIVEAKPEINGSFSDYYRWGKTEEQKTVVRTPYDVNVKPMTKVKVVLRATKGSCDIPFSYTRHDILLSGKPDIYNMDDGIYTCANCFKFHFETSEEPI